MRLSGLGGNRLTAAINQLGDGGFGIEDEGKLCSIVASNVISGQGSGGSLGLAVVKERELFLDFFV